MFREVARSGKDYGFFYEARANLTRETFEIMKKAGLERVQIGIEAMSTSMLEKFRKKARVIHNIQAMKISLSFQLVCDNVVLSSSTLVRYRY